jgi:hypothetical protein
VLENLAQKYSPYFVMSDTAEGPSLTPSNVTMAWPLSQTSSDLVVHALCAQWQWSRNSVKEFNGTPNDHKESCHGKWVLREVPFNAVWWMTWDCILTENDGFMDFHSDLVS